MGRDATKMIGAKNGFGRASVAEMSALPDLEAGKRPVVRLTGFERSVLKPLTIATKERIGFVPPLGAGTKAGSRTSPRTRTVSRPSGLNDPSPSEMIQGAPGDDPRSPTAMHTAERGHPGIAEEGRMD